MVHKFCWEIIMSSFSILLTYSDFASNAYSLILSNMVLFLYSVCYFKLTSKNRNKFPSSIQMSPSFDLKFSVLQPEGPSQDISTSDWSEPEPYLLWHGASIYKKPLSVPTRPEFPNLCPCGWPSGPDTSFNMLHTIFCLISVAPYTGYRYRCEGPVWFHPYICRVGINLCFFQYRKRLILPVYLCWAYYVRPRIS